MTHVVMFSGGIGSWAAAKRIRGDVVLLFADTRSEDSDLYRFIDEAAENIGAPLVKIADGRDIWQVFKDEKFMGNTRVDPCSKILKRKLADAWIAKHYTPETVQVAVGIDWTEIHRYERMAKRKLPWVYVAPLCDKPLTTKAEMIGQARAEGLTPPRLYDIGMPHNNCGGFCVKAGQGQFKILWENMPERYKEIEEKEQDVYDSIGSKRPFLRITEHGSLRYVTLREFREEFLEHDKQIDLFDLGGCGCFVDEEVRSA